jgi:hypothetical protein
MDPIAEVEVIDLTGTDTEPTTDETEAIDLTDELEAIDLTEELEVIDLTNEPEVIDLTADDSTSPQPSETGDAAQSRLTSPR